MINNKLLSDGLAAFVAKPTEGQYLVFQEYIDPYSMSVVPAIDLITILPDVGIEEMEVIDGNTHIMASCDYACHDMLCEIVIREDGRVYLDGDGVGHRAFRVTGMARTDLQATLSHEQGLTYRSGEPYIPE